ncbi:MAG: hypothetical protein QOI11_1845 [Candidatus Eremiobacteraeota bacterium]|jgi:hypothetical protein|nr:hypothetical protein [Candidatus Eremiobacteraeota bacterium]
MSNQLIRISELNLTAEQKEAVVETVTAAIAVNVYRELRAKAAAAASDTGCNIAGNCSSCSSRNVA